jgi:two-component system, OmpR family, alkaline phosphatase synthesis response regulator PhoP
MVRKTVMTVDDDPVVREAVNHYLSDEYNVLVAGDGHEAVQLLQEQSVDLILLDIMMPGFDGFSTLLLLKSDEKTRRIPVIMLTAVGRKEKVIAAFRDGASGYLLKPFDKRSLKNKIEAVLDQAPPAPDEAHD